MNPAGGKMPSTPRLSEYATNALEKIRKELRMFSIGDVQVSDLMISFDDQVNNNLNILLEFYSILLYSFTFGHLPTNRISI